MSAEESTKTVGQPRRSRPSSAAPSSSDLPKNVVTSGIAASSRPPSANSAPDAAGSRPPAVQVELVDRPEAVQEDAAQHEQRRLGEAVADHVDGDAGQRPCALEQPDAAHEHADVADRGEGEQALDVALQRST